MLLIAKNGLGAFVARKTKTNLARSVTKLDDLVEPGSCATIILRSTLLQSFWSVFRGKHQNSSHTDASAQTIVRSLWLPACKSRYLSMF